MALIPNIIRSNPRLSIAVAIGLSAVALVCFAGGDDKQEPEADKGIKTGFEYAEMLLNGDADAETTRPEGLQYRTGRKNDAAPVTP